MQIGDSLLMIINLSPIVLCLGSLVSWKSKKQNTVITSMMEGEYRSINFTIEKNLWTFYILQDLPIRIAPPIPLYYDSKFALMIARNPCLVEQNILMLTLVYLSSYCEWIFETRTCFSFLPTY